MSTGQSERSRLRSTKRPGPSARWPSACVEDTEPHRRGEQHPARRSRDAAENDAKAPPPHRRSSSPLSGASAKRHAPLSWTQADLANRSARFFFFVYLWGSFRREPPGALAPPFGQGSVNQDPASSQWKAKPTNQTKFNLHLINTFCCL